VNETGAWEHLDRDDLWCACCEPGVTAQEMFVECKIPLCAKCASEIREDRRHTNRHKEDNDGDSSEE
jgi:hypothetical protein